MFHITTLNSDLPNVSNEKETSIPLVFIDTAGCGVHELETEDTESKGNEGAIILHAKQGKANGSTQGRQLFSKKKAELP